MVTLPSKWPPSGSLAWADSPSSRAGWLGHTTLTIDPMAARFVLASVEA